MDNTTYAYDGNIRQIDHIDFDVLPNEEIRNRSAFGKDTQGTLFPDLYENNEPRKDGLADPRLGTIDINTVCPTCGFDTNFCPGHSGHMNLVEPFFHIGFRGHIKKFLDCICLKCSRVLIHKNEAKISEILKTKNGIKRLGEVYNAVKNVSSCPKCGTTVSKIRLEDKKSTGSFLIVAETDLENIKDESIQLLGKKKLKLILTPEIVYEKLKNISDDDCILLGMDPKRTRPENMIHTIFLIPPLAIRPSAKGDFLGGTTKEDGLTHRLVEIVRANYRIMKQRESGGENISKFANDASNLCQIHIAAYFDKDQISSPKGDQSKERSLAPGIKAKEGRIRGNLMGKRTDFTGRTVITSDPVIDFNEVRIPLKIAMIATFPEVVGPSNIEYLTSLVRKGRYNYPGANFVFPTSSMVSGQQVKPIDLRFKKEQIELRYGDIVERHLQSGDPVLLNRQPTLHKQSMMCHRAKVIPDPNLQTHGLSVEVTKPYNADFDGDEMNLFIPQSIQTQIELEELADVKKQIISPSSSRTSIGLAQDGLVGAYNLTAPTMRINWKNTMNIISYTGFEKLDTFKKNKNYSGHELFSLIIPPAININSGGLIIKNSILESGHLSKDVLGEKKNFAIHQIIWDSYGVKETKEFLDNSKRLIHNFNLYNGFTVGYGDACIDDSIKQDIDKLFATKEQKVNNMIAEIENNPNLMEKSVFEFKIMQEVSTTLTEVGKLIMKNLSPENNFNRMVSSGSKGSVANIAQISGCMGFQAVEGNLPPKKYNNRTLPYFHQNDDRIKSRGLIRESFFEGLDFKSFSFLLMAGREGIIDGALKTAITGYAQRRLVKCMEDVMIKYDGTVRTTNNSILQIAYADNGADTTKQYRYNIKFVNYGNKELKEKYIFSDKEMSLYKNYKYNDKLYDDMKQMRDEFRILMKKASCNFMSLQTNPFLPFNLGRVIDNIVNNKSLQTGNKVVPEYVYEKLNDILDNKNTNLLIISPDDKKNKKSVKKYDEELFKTFLKMALFDALSPKICINNLNLSKNQFDKIIDEIMMIYNKSIVEPGMMVGVLSAQALGETITQMNLNAFHSAGLSTMKSVTVGVPRIQELLSVSKNIKTPQLIVRLENQYKKSKDMAHKIASNLKYTNFSDIRGRISVYYDPFPNDDDSIMKADNVKNVYYNQKASKNSCQNNIDGLPWLMRIEIIKEKMLDKEISLLDIKSKFCNWWESRFNDIKNIKKEEKKVITKITNLAILSNSDNDAQPVIHLRFNVRDVDKIKDPFNRETLNDFIDHIVDKFKLKGIEEISDIPVIKSEKYISYDNEDKENKNDEEYVIYTSGINLNEIRYIIGIDILNSISNDIFEVYKTFGIEIARARLIRELNDAYEIAGHYVIYSHICLLADIMTSSGILMSIDRHGMGKSDMEILGRASFEKPVEQLLTASVFNETDHLRGVSSRSMCGNVIKGGTGYCDVILDLDMIEKSEYVEENKYKEYTEIITDNVAKDIVGRDNEEIFMPL
jgi:DNA-directed RNA polymerase II subunit RPB1